VVLVGAVAAAAALGVASREAEAGGVATQQRLRAFASCPQLLAHVKRETLPLVGAYGLGGATAGGIAAGAPEASAARAAGGTAGVDYSATNVQEEGVDEPDLVKTNGTDLFVVRGNTLFAVDVASSRPKVLGSLPLGEGWGGHELLLHGNRLLVLTRGGGVVYGLPGGATTRLTAPIASETTLTEVAVGDPSAMTVVRSMKLDADYVSARLVGATARIVTVSRVPQRLDFTAPEQSTTAATTAALQRNREIVRASRVGSWLPALAVRGRRGETLLRRPLVSCTNVRRPAVDSGLGMLTILTIDLKKGLAPVDSDAIFTDASTVYASQSTLYVATQRWPGAAAQTADPPRMTTAIHAFDTSDPQTTTYRGSGAVGGYLFGQWALSEHDGVLRVASTEEPTWWNPTAQEESESFVTTLRQRGGALAQVGRVGGLGKGERVYAVRFIGDTGYVVTFRRVDPLYTLDVADPTAPRVVGELKIRGYSAYLHPLGDGLLLGVGQDATAEGRVTGAQLSVFDVSDARRPSRLHHWTLGSSWSEAESDHHAFLWWPRDRLAVLPVTAYDPKVGPTFSGAVGFRVGRSSGIEEVLRVTHPTDTGDAAVRRSLVVGDRLYTVSDAGVRATGVSGRGDAGWAAFPRADAGGSKPSG
jgi:uncharacterized secreted protein with C-terminal beta-propeller domain